MRSRRGVRKIDSSLEMSGYYQEVSENLVDIVPSSPDIIGVQICRRQDSIVIT